MNNTTSQATPEPRRRSRTPGLLIEATKRLLSRGTLTGFTIDDVVREADVARSSFYNHFSTLEALVALTVSTVQEDLYEHIRLGVADSDDPVTKIARGVAISVRYSYDNPSSAKILNVVGPGITDPHGASNQLLTSHLTAGIESGVIKVPSLDVAVVCVIGICEMGVSRMLDLRHEYTLVRDLTHGLCVAVLRGLGVDARRVDRAAKEALHLCFDRQMQR